MVKDGYYFVAPPAAAAALLLYLGWWPAAAVCAALAAFCAFFFRDPNREIPVDPRAIVSPADGKIVQLSGHREGTIVSIFLSVFDVHVNRAPIDGEVVRQEHRPGKFLLAFDERASAENEQLRMTLSGEREIRFSLIAGLVARRIVPWTKPGDRVAKGDRIGLIRFGSRVDILIPQGCRLNVKKGDRVRGGASVVAFWDGDS